MFKTILKSIMLLVGMLVVQACNSDIFVEPAPEIPESISLPGHDGSQTLNFSRKALKGVWAYNNNGWQEDCIYYDADGEKLNGNPGLSRMAKMVYLTQYCALEVNLKSDDVEIAVLDNAFGRDIELFVVFDFGYQVKIVEVKIGVGLPHVISSFGYFIDEYVTDEIEIEGVSQTVHNNTSQTISATIYPYKDAQSKLTLYTGEDSDWAFGGTGKIEVPYFKDGQWTVYQSEELEATVGATTSFYSRMVDTEEAAHVEVPPYTSLRIRPVVTYATLETGYTALMRLPATDFSWMVVDVMRLMQPVGYKIETTTLDL